MSSRLYSFILRQYNAGKIDDDWLSDAVIAGWITADEKTEILNAS